MRYGQEDFGGDGLLRRFYYYRTGMSVGDEIALQPARKTMRIAIGIGQVVRVLVTARLNSRGPRRVAGQVMKVREAYEERVRHQAKQRKRLGPRPFIAHHSKLVAHSQMEALPGGLLKLNLTPAALTLSTNDYFGRWRKTFTGRYAPRPCFVTTIDLYSQRTRRKIDSSGVDFGDWFEG